MKITYEFATETVEIEVSEDWANLVIDLDRQEYNNNHAETRRHVSYETENSQLRTKPISEKTFLWDGLFRLPVFLL